MLSLFSNLCNIHIVHVLIFSILSWLFNMELFMRISLSQTFDHHWKFPGPLLSFVNFYLQPKHMYKATSQKKRAGNRIILAARCTQSQTLKIVFGCTWKLDPKNPDKRTLVWKLTNPLIEADTCRLKEPKQLTIFMHDMLMLKLARSWSMQLFFIKIKQNNCLDFCWILFVYAYKRFVQRQISYTIA